MKKEDLALQLRTQQIVAGHVSAEIIQRATDDDIVDSYITCSHCGHKQVSGPQLARAIALARNTDDFLAILGVLWHR